MSTGYSELYFVDFLAVSMEIVSLSQRLLSVFSGGPKYFSKLLQINKII
jgi:hypothetical protein